MSREHAIPPTHLFLETRSLRVGVEAAKRNLRSRFEPASTKTKTQAFERGLRKRMRKCICTRKRWENKESDLNAAVVSRHGEQGWRSGEKTRLPPMWPEFNSRTRRHMWVEFVAGSLLCSERFFSGYSGFPLSAKTNISKFQIDPECSSV